MKQYRDLLTRVLNEGEERNGRNGLTRSLFGAHLEVDCRDGFPIITAREIHFKSIVVELLWFLKGGDNIKYLLDNGVNIWNKNAYESYRKGTPNPVSYSEYVAIGKTIPADVLRNTELYSWYNTQNIYGKFWAEQLPVIWQNIKNNPYERRHVVQVPILENKIYNIETQCLPPCHILWQLYVSNDNFIDIHIYQRSADIFLGVPFNISSYALLLHLFANELNLTARRVIFSYGDVHLYSSHITQAKEYLTKPDYPLPSLELCAPKGSNENWHHPFSRYNLDDIKLNNYQFGDKIKATMIV